VLDQSIKCTAYNGRYLMMGFASDKTKADQPFIVPDASRPGTASCAACC
jgi:hypothetical protein